MQRASLLDASFSPVAHLEAPNQSVWWGRGGLSGPPYQQRLLAMALSGRWSLTWPPSEKTLE